MTYEEALEFESNIIMTTSATPDHTVRLTNSWLEKQRNAGRVIHLESVQPIYGDGKWVVISIVREYHLPLKQESETDHSKDH